MGKPWLVAFVGAGDATEANIKNLLDDWMHDGRDYKPPMLPAEIPNEHTGLVRVMEWLYREFGSENVDELPQVGMLAQLVEAKENGTAEPSLVYIPGPDDKYAGLVSNALAEGIPVLDLTVGLYPYDNTGGHGEVEPEEKSTVAKPLRGRPRQAANPDAPTKEEIAASMADPNPPWDEDDDPAKGKATPDSTNNTEAVEQMLDAEAAAWDEEALQANLAAYRGALSQDTIDLVLKALDSFARDIKTFVTPAAKQKTSPYWLSEDGAYRVRGQGRGRKGETAVDLTDAQVEDLQNRGLL